MSNIDNTAGGWTKTPNAILEALPDMSEAEMKLTAVLVRQTYGYHRTEIKLTYDDMQELAKLSRGGVSAAIDAVEARGFFSRGRRSMWYANSLPNRLNEDAEIVQEIDQKSLETELNNLDDGLANGLPLLEKESKREKKTKESPPNPPRGRAKEDELHRHWEEIVDLADVFTAATGIKPPSMSSNHGRKAVIDKWATPLWDMRQLSNGHTEELIRSSIQEMDVKGLTIASPGSIVSTFTQLHRKLTNPPAVAKPDERTAGLKEIRPGVF